ncbi:MAG: hypothetical protein JXR83_01330 [Deltaproteobacteria bacterium]|nr:hypothetical protein [Deltaproteobacteria bacterium]
MKAAHVQAGSALVKGEPELDPELKEHGAFEESAAISSEPLPVVYNKAVPPEFFDIIFIDECQPDRAAVP